MADSDLWSHKVPRTMRQRMETARVRSTRVPALSATSPGGPIATDTLFNLMADRTRRRLLALLLEEREICVCLLAESLDVSQPKISRHLALLRQAGLLAPRRQGTQIFYRLDPGLAGWAVRIVAMTTEGARAEPYHDADRERLTQAKVRRQQGVP